MLWPRATNCRQTHRRATPHRAVIFAARRSAWRGAEWRAAAWRGAAASLVTRPLRYRAFVIGVGGGSGGTSYDCGGGAARKKGHISPTG